MFREVIQALFTIMPWLVIGELGLEETCVSCHVCATGGIRLYTISIGVQTLSKTPKPLFSPVSPGLPWLLAGLLLPLTKLCLQCLQPGCCQLLVEFLLWAPALSTVFPSHRGSQLPTGWLLRTKLGVTLGMLFESWFRNSGWGFTILFCYTIDYREFTYVSFSAPPYKLVDAGAAYKQGQGLLKDPGVLWTQSRGALFSVTASYSATHGPSQGDNKLRNCRIKQWRKGRTSWMSAWLWNVNTQPSATWRRKVSNNGEPPAGSPAQRCSGG